MTYYHKSSLHPEEKQSHVLMNNKEKERDSRIRSRDVNEVPKHNTNIIPRISGNNRNLSKLEKARTDDGPGSSQITGTSTGESSETSAGTEPDGSGVCRVVHDDAETKGPRLPTVGRSRSTSVVLEYSDRN